VRLDEGARRCDRVDRRSRLEVRVAFGVAEFDAAFTDRIAVLADRKNGTALAGRRPGSSWY
jgi:hypothetical protein